MNGILKEGYRVDYNGYTITTEYVKNTELVGDRKYRAIAFKDGIKVNHHDSSFSFEGAIEQLKPLLDFKLSVN